jgi:uncharacterized cupin superfamily protein
MIDSIVSLAGFDDAPQTYLPAPERIVSGNPLQRVWVRYEDSSAQFCVGQWACDSGSWRVVYTEHEYCEMLAGRIRMTDDAGAVCEVVAGDRFVVPAGFTGIWEVLEPACKNFVIYEAKD